jgi:hypothetical protein
MLKRPVVNLNLTSCLTEDDMDLRVTICHIRDDRFEPELTFSARTLVTLPLLQLLNSQEASLLMYCITALLTSLISQALLQAALDKETSGFTG